MVNLRPYPRLRLAPLLAFTLSAVAALSALRAAEYHVALTGSDTAAGSATAPFRTIQRAADAAQPGDTITVHAGTYRERVNPPRGGSSDTQRITYRAAPGERVVISGSEVVTGWTHVAHETWKLTLPNARFGDFNPFADLIRGDWFDRKGRDHHTGAVYLNGHWLAEAATLAEVLAPARSAATPLWFATVDATATTVHAQFPGVDPNTQLTEVNARRTVFYPDQPGRNYLTVRGFILEHAATPWSPPTAEQVGLIGTHWSKGWIIEDNTIRYSTCVGLTLGKHGDEHDNTSADSAEGYVATIRRAHAYRIPWDRAHVGHHIVRRNTIAHCEQAGIVGSLGAAFSLIEGNRIHDIHRRFLFAGAEQAGIKFHGAIDTIIRGNRIYRANRGLWLDWMTQGTRVTANVLHDNTPNEDLFFEVNHGPHLVDNNVCLSPVSLLDMSQGGAYVHNLFAGRITTLPEPNRDTPYHPPHDTAVAGLTKVRGGDNRWVNNLFVGRPGEPLTDDSEWGRKVRPTTAFGLCNYDRADLPVLAAGNLYLNGACPSAHEKNATVSDRPAAVKLVDTSSEARLELTLPVDPRQVKTTPVTTARLGQTHIAKAAYEQPDGRPLEITTDLLGHPRGSTPTPGPLETLHQGENSIPLP